MSDTAPEMAAKLREAENKVRIAEDSLKELKDNRIKMTLLSGVAGFMLFAVGAHWFPGYQLDSTAANAANAKASTAVSDIMAAICAERFVQAPDLDSRLLAFDKVSGSWEKASYIRDGVWAVKPDGERPDISTAESCSNLIAEHVSKVQKG